MGVSNYHQKTKIQNLYTKLAIEPARVRSINTQLQEGEKAFAFLDDIYIVCQPDRVKVIYDIMGEALWTHCRIRINAGKTKVWNQNGLKPPGVEDLGENAWMGDHALPSKCRGLKILGLPSGHDDYVRHFLEGVHDDRQHL